MRRMIGIHATFALGSAVLFTIATPPASFGQAADVGRPSVSRRSAFFVGGNGGGGARTWYGSSRPSTFNGLTFGSSRPGDVHVGTGAGGETVGTKRLAPTRGPASGVDLGAFVSKRRSRPSPR